MTVAINSPLPVALPLEVTAFGVDCPVARGVVEGHRVAGGVGVEVGEAGGYAGGVGHGVSGVEGA